MAYGRRPLLTTRFTFVPIGSRLRGRGFCEITWFLLTCEYLWLILPVRQWALRSARFAASTVFPFSFGTRQPGFSENLAVTVRG